ncbi:hypothetical protein NAB79_19615, partial [Proteus mirabilis]|nr:hypothetical protein [Proteus mirabilis]
MTATAMMISTSMMISTAMIASAVAIGLGVGILILSCCGIRDHDEGHSNQNSHEKKHSLESHCKLDLTLLCRYVKKKKKMRTVRMMTMTKMRMEMMT